MDYQWYPGHMTKAKRAMAEDIKLIDLIIELVDARIPLSSRNPDIDELGKNKARLILLNKADLADDDVTKLWEQYFTDLGYFVCCLDSRKKNYMKQVSKITEDACAKKRERDKKRGIKNRPLRAMVVGIPNVGKSTFINSFAGKAVAKTGNKPGVTKGKQWIRLNKSVELLDTPGILWPKFEDQRVGFNLACIGSMNDNVINIQSMASDLLAKVIADYPGLVRDRYDVDESSDIPDIFTQIAVNRNCIKKGGEPDFDKAINLFTDEFRSGVLGRISLEKPEV